jgi:hypothetical protein
MGTYSRPGSAVSPYMIDRSAELLSKELGVAGDELIKQKENILISRNKLAEDNATLKSGINSVEGGAGLEFKNNLTNMMSGLVDEANVLGINSIGRDQTEYINKKSNIMTAVDQLPKLLAILDEEAKMYGDTSDPSRQILNSTDPLAREFMDNIRIYNGKDIRPEYKDGNIILKYTGKNGKEFVLNSANYQRARENGTGGLIDYSKDHNTEWKTIFDNLTNDTNYKELQTKLMEESATGKTTVTTREKWEQANKELRQRLENSTTLLPTLDQSTFQLFYPGKEDELWTASDSQIKDLKSKVVDEIMNNYAGTTKITSIVEKERTDAEKIDLARKRVSLKKAKESLSEEDFSKYESSFTSEIQSAANIIAAESQTVLESKNKDGKIVKTTTYPKAEALLDEIGARSESGKMKDFIIKDNKIKRKEDAKFSDQQGKSISVLSLSKLEAMTEKELIRFINNNVSDAIPEKAFETFMTAYNPEEAEEVEEIPLVINSEEFQKKLKQVPEIITKAEDLGVKRDQSNPNDTSLWEWPSEQSEVEFKKWYVENVAEKKMTATSSGGNART